MCTYLYCKTLNFPLHQSRRISPNPPFLSPGAHPSTIRRTTRQQGTTATMSAAQTSQGSWRIPDLLAMKRDGLAYSEDQIAFLVRSVSDRSMDDCQLGEWVVAAMQCGWNFVIVTIIDVDIIIFFLFIHSFIILYYLYLFGIILYICSLFILSLYYLCLFYLFSIIVVIWELRSLSPLLSLLLYWWWGWWCWRWSQVPSHSPPPTSIRVNITKQEEK